MTSDGGIDGIGETYRGESCAAFDAAAEPVIGLDYDAVEKYRVS